ncbi:hypothetical protein Tco_0681159 [Tanacetum coccineum]|uniref:Uncharacterized protein n=1 Tax=Tanacetum coccineum TaxID=301880 RepID=A0ABQ4XP52_9ASTR
MIMQKDDKGKGKLNEEEVYNKVKEQMLGKKRKGKLDEEEVYNKLLMHQLNNYPGPKKPIYSEVKVTNWIHGLRATKAADVGTFSKWRRTMFRNEVK